MATLNWFLNALQVALGLGFVIFLHELGHFLLAKWNGVKVEKFSIGFGPTLLGFTRGETEYVLAAVPLGGFVKMLGEGVEDETNKSSDPRAFPNKSVGARMAIISAGVVMNLVLGLACFVYAYKMGIEELPTKIGAVKSGSPAYAAGMRPGDEIVAIDGRRDLSFNNLTLKVRLSRLGQLIHFEVKRPGVDAEIPMDIEPRRDSGADFPGIGVAPSRSLTLADPPFRAAPGLDPSVKLPDAQAGLRPDDEIVALGVGDETPTPVADVQGLYALLARYQAEPVTLTVRRKGKGAAGSTADAATATATLPPNRFVDFGLRFKAEPVAVVRAGSPAEAAGFRKGDAIVKVDGDADFDPMRLPSKVYAHAGRPMIFEVERPSNGGGSPEALTLTVTPDDSPAWTGPPFDEAPLDVPGLGLAYPIRTKVEGVAPDSPADKAGIKPGDVVNALTFPPIKGEKKKRGDDFTFDKGSNSWPSAFFIAQFRPAGPVELRVNNASTAIKLTPTPDPNWFLPLRGEVLTTLTRRTPPMGVASALRRGWDDTVENVLTIYATFRSLAQSRLSPKNLGGPLEIARVAFIAAGLSFTELIRFLGILSINLAVLNFLPIPPLDGGVMAFLVAEKVRGRPLPESALAAGTWAGLLLVLCLMVFVIFQDVSRYVSDLF